MADLNYMASHVQIRGSIPLFWAQRANLRYKPRVEIDQERDHSVPLRRHVDSLVQSYGSVVAVNLVWIAAVLSHCFLRSEAAATVPAF